MKIKKNTFKSPKYVFFFFLFCLIVLYGQYVYVALFPVVYDINMSEFASNRNTYTTTLYAQRGNVYDNEGNNLAFDVTTYTVIAYLNESRTGSSSIPYHVVDYDYTASSLASVLGGEKDYYLELLNSGKEKGLYQTYLGVYGNINESTKQKLENLKIPGISFEASYERYYPNGDFASYILGYAKKQNTITVTVGNEYELEPILKSLYNSFNVVFRSDSENISINNNVLKALVSGSASLSIYEDGEYTGSVSVVISDDVVVTKLEEKITGELGIESKYEEILRGINGYQSYQADRFGYKIPDTKEEKIDALSGSDVYLTLDSNVQRIIESSVTDIEELYEPEWITFTVMDAKTGDILGSASSPSFNPNDLNTITNYENPLTSFVYEPGSVMKIYTYMCAMENGVYDGNETFLSGSIEIEEDVVSDWNNVGWGEITYDVGFQLSSNVAVSTIMQDKLSASELKDCFNKYGFGSTTGIDLPREMSGKLDFTYPIEIASASFGQGILTTPIQQLQALSLIANNGNMVRPNIVDKIVTDGEVVYESSVEVVENVISSSTSDYMRTLMYNTVNLDSSVATGTYYQVDDLSVIGKTGTGQYYSEEHGGYTKINNIYSFSGMFPYEDPEIIIFASVKEPNVPTSRSVSSLVQPSIESIAKYLGIISNDVDIDSYTEVSISNYKNKNINVIKDDLTIKGLEVVVLGDGDIITNQYPLDNSKLLSGDKIYLVTNGNILMPNLIGYSKIEVISLLNLLEVDYVFEGNGIVYEQNVLPGSELIDVIVKFKKEELNESSLSNEDLE